jgi:hypothetical protein
MGTTTLRSDTWLITLSIDGGPAITMDTFKGGDKDSSVTQYRPGGMAAQKVVGGQTSVSNINMEKSLEMETDWAVVQNLMRARVGSSRCVVGRQPLDPNGVPFGSPLVYTGTLKQCGAGDTDSDKSEVDKWTVEIMPDSPIG